MRTLTDAVMSVALAPVCAACGHPLEAPTLGVVCQACWGRVRPLSPPFCAVCAEPLRSWRTSRDERCARCRATPPAVSRGSAVGEYEGALRAILRALKYDRRTSLAPKVSAMMRAHGQSLLTGADLVVPVPLHWRRQWQRGFNQAEALASGLGLPVVGGLSRTRATRTQTELPAEERHANVRDAFAIRRREELAGGCVVLVDDVSTTGATLNACARVLLDAGVREVRALTAAKAVLPPSAAHQR